MQGHLKVTWVAGYFSSGSVAKILSSQCRRPGSNYFFKVTWNPQARYCPLGPSTKSREPFQMGTPLPRDQVQGNGASQVWEAYPMGLCGSTLWEELGIHMGSLGGARSSWSLKAFTQPPSQNGKKEGLAPTIDVLIFIPGPTH